METLEIYKSISLPSNFSGTFGGFTFDGYFFYLTVPEMRCIYKLDQSFDIIDQIRVVRAYSCVCFDYQENCFWATEENNRTSIYKLNRNFKMLDRIRLQDFPMPIRGLAYDDRHDSLLAACDDQIVNFSKHEGYTLLLQEELTGNYESILSISPYFAVLRHEKSSQEIRFYNLKNNLLKVLRVSPEYQIKDMVLHTQIEHAGSEIEIFMLSEYLGVPAILYCQTSEHDMIPYNEENESAKTGGMPSASVLSYDSRRKDHCPHEPNSQSDKDEADESPGCPSKDAPDSQCSSCEKNGKQCICDLIESIALVETALSHILNAEGEKLQKAVSISTNIHDLMEINKSVNKTLTNATLLENALYTKLDALSELYETPLLNLK